MYDFIPHLSSVNPADSTMAFMFAPVDPQLSTQMKTVSVDPTRFKEIMKMPEADAKAAIKELVLSLSEALSDTWRQEVLALQVKVPEFLTGPCELDCVTKQCCLDHKHTQKAIQVTVNQVEAI